MNIKKFICSIISLALLSTVSVNVNASTLPNLNELPEIQPYQEVINKLNSELGSEISIPDNSTIELVSLDRDEIYNHITSLSTSEFEEELRNEYNNFFNSENLATNNYDLSEGELITIPTTEDTTKSISNNINSRSISATTSQKRDLYNSNGENRGTVTLNADVFSPTGISGTFYYTNINSTGYYTYSDRTHFRATNSSYSFSNSRKDCTVKYTGSHYTASGIMLTGIISYTVTYNAG